MTGQIKYLGIIVYLRILKLLKALKEAPGEDNFSSFQAGKNFDGLEFLESLNIKKYWKGISKNLDYPNDVHMLIKDNICFEEEWLRLGIDSPVPEIDFNRKMVIEIVKKNASRELILKDVYYKGIKGEKIKKEILYDFYIDSTVESRNSAYLLLVTAKSDLPISFNEKRYYDGIYIDKGYYYLPAECG